MLLVARKPIPGPLVQKSQNTSMIGTSLDTRRLAYLRDLLRELVIRDMKVRYKRSVLGIAWSLVTPLIQLLVFTFLFGKVISLGIPNYPLFILAGLLPWNWFTMSLVQATVSVVENRELVKLPGFPAAILPAVTVTAHLVHFLLALLLLILFMLVWEIRLTMAVAALPVVILSQYALTVGLAYFAAASHVRFRDTQHIVNVLLTLAFFLAPVFYDAGAVPSSYQMFYRLNPMVHLLAAYRAVLIRGELPGVLHLLALGVSTGGFLLMGYLVFNRASSHFDEDL